MLIEMRYFGSLQAPNTWFTRQVCVDAVEEIVAFPIYGPSAVELWLASSKIWFVGHVTVRGQGVDVDIRCQRFYQIKKIKLKCSGTRPCPKQIVGHCSCYLSESDDEGPMKQYYRVALRLTFCVCAGCGSHSIQCLGYDPL